MNKRYLIQWRSKVNGRSGRGARLFKKHEAEQLVEELNREYPQIEHQLLEVQSEIRLQPAESPEETESPLVPPPAALSTA